MSIEIVVPGHGHPARTKTLLTSLLRLQHGFMSYGFTCSVYLYINVSIPLNMPCTVHPPRPGTWVTFMKLHRSTSSFIGILLDDVLVDLNAQRLLNIVSSHANVVSPSISKWYHPVMRPMYATHDGYRPSFRKHPCVRDTAYVDVLFTLFDAPAWRCWQNLLDPSKNPNGWGTDVVFAEACKVRIAVSDHDYLFHTGKKTLYSTPRARTEMLSWLACRWNTTLKRARYRRWMVLRESSMCFFHNNDDI